MTTLSHTELDQLASAWAKAQAEMPTVRFDKTVSFKNVNFEYASLSNIIEVTKPVLAKHGLSILQFPQALDGMVIVETMVLHVSGQYLKWSVSAKVSKAEDPKELGSWVSYLRRYSYAVIGLAIDDDHDAANIGEKYIGTPEQKVWLRDFLSGRGLDLPSIKSISDEMIRANYEASEDDALKAMGVLRK
jgi:hypothetical protein